VMNSLLKFALIVLLVVSVCAAPSERVLKSKIHRRVSQNRANGGNFTPHELPCKYKITQTQYLKQEGDEQTEYITFRTFGPFFRVDYSVPSADFIETLIVRPDISIPDPDSDKVYIEEFHGATMFLDKTENLLIEQG